MQRVYEWRNRIGTTAVEAVKELWASQDKYKVPDERKAYVAWALGPRLLFIYREVKKVGEDSWEVSTLFLSCALMAGLTGPYLGALEVRKSYQGPLILKTLVAHLKDIALVNTAKYYNMVDECEPRGALILAMTAVGLTDTHDSDYLQY